jgi:hypothetical protein
MKTLALSLLAFVGLTIGFLYGQSATPDIIIQAATPVPVASVGLAKPVTGEAATSLKAMLEEMKATNKATLQKQEAALRALDDLQKAAEELKIFSKRG